VYRTLELTAHAKLNLTLRVVGRRSDGLHLLDGITVFCMFGDKLRVSESDGADAVSLTGPFAAHVEGENIVSKAVHLYRAVSSSSSRYTIQIEKNIPVAAGLGGGSCDAGAVLRALQRLSAVPIDDNALNKLAIALGADVPVCLACESVRMEGIGERLTAIGPVPALKLVLINPGVPITAGSIFRRFHGPYSAPLPLTEGVWSRERLFAYVGASAHNDLMESAAALAPVVLEVLDALATWPGVRCAGMSGSGATCFAIFGSDEQRHVETAVENARARGWWATGTELLA
jgi:4-diphosphocytidyl-2-C-methyl-D-erythritol kinase